MRSRHHFQQHQRPARASLFLALAIALSLAMLGHDALMAGGAHAATRSHASATVHSHSSSLHDHGGDPETPPAPCSAIRDMVSRADPDVQATALSAVRVSNPQPTCESSPLALRPMLPLPADVRRALLQVFLN